MPADAETVIDIRIAAQRVMGFIQGYTLDQFQEDEKTWSAVLYQIGILGEAVKRLSPS